LPFTARAAAIGLVLHASEAFAQAPKVTEAAAYAGPDREQRLAEGGRREGSLTLYSNAPTEDNAALVGAFTKKYGIKIYLWRASSEDIRQRVLTEARAKRFDVDFVLNNAPALEALRNEICCGRSIRLTSPISCRRRSRCTGNGSGFASTFWLRHSTRSC
jgi:iron(III) transport system substrate-binding protein